jgi:ubiquitin-like-conjugating enzyme ATG3
MNIINKIVQITTDNAASTYNKIHQIATGEIVNTSITTINSYVEYMVPVLTNSQFKEKGILTPEEFILSCDYLVNSSSKWKWESGDIKLRKLYLQEDKQFIICKGIPIIDTYYTDEHDIDDMTSINNSYLEELESDSHSLSDYKTALESPLESSRMYDISITYDKYYRTPRIWLNGYDNKGFSISPEKMLQDISAEHSNKTVTIEYHPHFEKSLLCITIHPCTHASVMKMILSIQEEEIAIEKYMSLFLSFVSTIIPNLSYF